MTREFVRATYRIETPLPLEQAAEAMAGEQSTGTFVRVPGETEELRDALRRRVERITSWRRSTSRAFPAPGAPRGAAAGRYRRAEVVLSFPLENMGPTSPTLLATVAGNLFELRSSPG